MNKSGHRRRAVDLIARVLVGRRGDHRKGKRMVHIAVTWFRARGDTLRGIRPHPWGDHIFFDGAKGCARVTHEALADRLPIREALAAHYQPAS